MGAKTKKVGGSEGGAKVGSSFTDQILKLLGGQSGQMGAGNIPGGGAMGMGQGAADIYGSILGQGAGNIGGALMQLLQRTQDRDVAKLKEGFRGSGGAQFGTPGAYAESMYRGEAAPNITKAIGELQLNAANNIFGMAKDVYGRETAQADTLVEPGIFDKIIQSVGALSGAAQKVFSPGLLAKGSGGGTPGTTAGEHANGAVGPV